ncbi:NADH dehydrogenase I J subunit protein [Halorhabdus tiamatea SARL4B]|uniref:NADH dehydrogenase I J subunit protein n=1 Tax=Halorhabdus tiamatea SARL4B TaxID=1033806 RepID=F7PQ46_9EURY|nr:NADH-quinone oxidoreductase subunit J [Halorhabdus tiamatea]ERJ07225.1 NADH dehydrogenase I J subunit protein [Halorhabdus tiamatea SARL4B]CCQ34138.1 NADH-ubiquinone oxidoreductase, chain 6 [Halorhabdus tiamatea SARL4B]
MTTLTTAALVATVGLAVIAVAARDFLVSILSLSGASVGLAVYFYLAGAPIAAVFEAVVAAGLVTVLFLMMISLTDAETATRIEGRKLPIVGLALGALLGVTLVVWGWLGGLSAGGGSEIELAEALWAERSIDLLAVTVLLFVGVLGIVRLTAERFDATDRAVTSEGAPIGGDETRKKSEGDT